MSDKTYEQLTLTERAELHILAARTLLGSANAQLQQLNSRLGVSPAEAAGLIAAAHAMWAGAQAEATIANTIALLAANEGKERGRFTRVSDAIR